MIHFKRFFLSSYNRSKDGLIKNVSVDALIHHIQNLQILTARHQKGYKR